MLAEAIAQAEGSLASPQSRIDDYRATLTVPTTLGGNYFDGLTYELVAAHIGIGIEELPKVKNQSA
jgi:cytochrome c peroxidase